MTHFAQIVCDAVEADWSRHHKQFTEVRRRRVDFYRNSRLSANTGPLLPGIWEGDGSEQARPDRKEAEETGIVSRQQGASFGAGPAGAPGLSQEKEQ
jgi:hypothetical protein